MSPDEGRVRAAGAAGADRAAARIAGRCDHCGRPVRATQHTRGGYAVDYYSLHSGHGEVAAFSGDDRTRTTYVRLLDHFDLTTCVDCYRRTDVQALRAAQFRPERDASPEPGSA
jgi:hypothetical protein